LISHVDAQIDAEPLRVFISSYQKVSSLKLGELWAVPIMLRLALIENLRRVTCQLAVARRERDLADQWVDRLQQMADENPSHLVVVVAEMAQSDLPLTSSFVGQFNQRLSRQSSIVHLARTWLEQRLAEQGQTIEQMVHLETQNQAADQVSISHSINSLRFLGAMDWREFVEQMSLVDQTLRAEPAGIYGQMDFSTRDRYRHCVEALARHSRFSEIEVAQKAVQLSMAAGVRSCPTGRSQGAAGLESPEALRRSGAAPPVNGAAPVPGSTPEAASSCPRNHVGFYLVDKGVPALARALEVRWPAQTALERAVRRVPLAFYTGGIALLTLTATFYAWWKLLGPEAESWKSVVFILLLLVSSSQLAVSIMNWLTNLLLQPRLLPRLDFTSGIPSEFRTVVVVPTMLATPAGIDALIETLEIHYLANRDKHLHFALLTDFLDAPQEKMPDDDALLQHARAGVALLDRKYQADRPNIFYLFHRPRRWNPRERIWMAYERKRGKLADFNALLRGGSREPFSEIVGDVSVLSVVKFVITLDTDTHLPRDAARRLAGTLAHPLNRPRFDPVRGTCTDGYSILQPRVGVSLPSAGRSWYVRLFAGEVGIDPYTRAASDVYQDLFQEGSFIGKGIYDLDAFERALGGRFPENCVLSHDLIESCFARSALVSDVEFYEEHPARYLTDVHRRHRWIRGDWQIARWLLPRVPGPNGRAISNPLSGVSQWKIFDNLRRSFVPGALVLLLTANWILLPQFSAFGLIAVLAVVGAPGLLSALAQLFRKTHELPLEFHLRKVGRSFALHLSQALLTIICLPYDAFISADAVFRSLFRLIFSRRHLLQWKTPSEVERTARNDQAAFYAAMWIAPLLSLAFTIYIALAHRSEFPFALPFLALWLVSPLVAWRISQPMEPPTPELREKQIAFLRRMTRKTWRFFETFVNAEENWLPPDNFQEEPAPVIASRTSPTNIGAALLSNLAAWDFGYSTTRHVIERTGNAFASMDRLERHRGHFYNWYDTRSLKPLYPLYVSSVDSGNLAGHLLILSAGLSELEDQSVLPKQAFAGLHDTASILREELGKSPELNKFLAEVENPPADFLFAFALLQRLTSQAERITASLPKDSSDEVRWWANSLERACHDHFNDILYLVPWLAPPADSGALSHTLLVEGRGQGGGGQYSPLPEPPLTAALQRLAKNLTLREISELEQSLCPILESAIAQQVSTLHAPNASAAPNPTSAGQGGLAAPKQSEGGSTLPTLLAAVRDASERASQRISALEALSRQASEFAHMDFTFLFDPARDLFSIGYNVSDHRRDSSFYDLLASEARLCSYVAIAQGQVPQDHWFSLGRLLVPSRLEPVLASWNGSLFEYLMPLLVMPNYERTLLDQTYRGVIEQQIAYGQSHDVPWGVSESGYNRTDAHLNYQYKAFGVPGLGLKRGLAEDLVIAPYATMMALMVAPRKACDNLERLVAEGQSGAYGFYEAIDYTPSRLPPGQSSVTIRSFMAHHQGMGLLSLNYLLLDRPMHRRFMGCPLLHAADLLLQERAPSAGAEVLSEDLEFGETRQLATVGQSAMRVVTNPSMASPEVHLLSNGRYHVVISSAGGGYSRWRDLAVTRWREDTTRDCWGTFMYMRDLVTNESWSAALQPTLQPAKHYEAIFTQARAEFRQQQNGLELHTDICVSPEDDLELRRLTIVNRSSVPRVIEVTSYAEVVLAQAAADAAHPAFSNLFVQTEFASPNPAILCTRRARSEEEKPPWLVHLMVGEGGEQGEVSCETDRARFVGRGRNVATPAALRQAAPLSNTTGPVLDPIISLRRTITIAPHEKARIDLVIGVVETREAALGLVEKYHYPRMADRGFELAWTHSEVVLRQLNATEADAQLYARLASALIYANPARRAASSTLLSNRRGQNGLWSYGISGDLPVVLVRIGDAARMELVRQLIQAHAYWRMKGLAVELVIINEDVSVYRQGLHDQIVNLIASGIEAQLLDKPGGIFVRRTEQILSEDRVLLQSVARVVLSDENGTLAEQLDRPPTPELIIPALKPSRPAAVSSSPARRSASDESGSSNLKFPNGLGGFTPDGREYVIMLSPGRTTPAPWVNVLANAYFGTVVSEAGTAYTWVENCHEFRLTPWNNDPVSDPTGEALYIRDDETGTFWSPTPLPARGETPYLIRHGFGYTVFEHTEFGIVSELTVFAAMDAPVKFSVLKLRNVSGRARKLSVTGYWEWVLGELRHKTLLHIQTEVDSKSGALLARNHYSTEFAERIAYVDVNDPSRTFTSDRREFIGRNGTLAQPAALKRVRLSGKVGAGLDPCSAVQVAFDLPPGQTRETCFRLGVGRSAAEVTHLIQRYRRADSSRTELDSVTRYWNRTLGALQIETPDPSVNIMANGWLLYQALSCRVWGRTGFYQSGGAYGFRDQLQDVMALIHAEPGLTREHLLRAATHQFREGDVQHWWHPPSGRGVRTHFSDDYLWLPYATCHYVQHLKDTGVLDEQIPFLEGRPVNPDEESYYDLPIRSDQSGTIYEHCVRAIQRGLRFGPHGLPLIGCGDWNDGFNQIGIHGKGESVWLGFFLYDVLSRFADLARLRNDHSFAERCLAEAAQLRENIERHAWDGQWYLRAWFDNGEPLGSSSNPECQIDSLSQSWSVISGAGDATRSRDAMQAVTQRLVHRDLGLIKLFDPPFNNSNLNPGYIKGYVPGVRENGGQYTHGAVWTVRAAAELGQNDLAWELLSILNPIQHSATPAQATTYKVEPYVVAADIYGEPPHVGRGGWTWYTGSAGLIYRLITESLLGISREGDKLRIQPRLPAHWPGFKLHYRYRETMYHITIKSARGAATKSTQTQPIKLTDDRHDHNLEFEVAINSSPPQPAEVHEPLPRA
jgi:cellobiose phosphorylase